MCISTCHYGSMHGSVRVHMVYSARVELAVRITARCADLRPFCPLTPAPGALARLLSAAHKAGWLSSVMPAPSGWLGLPARCGRADGWIVPRHMAWLSLQAVARRRRRWGGRPVRRGAERPGGERSVASYRPEEFPGVACQDIGPEPVMHLRWTGDAPVVYLRR
jgi:hypothetical protein